MGRTRLAWALGLASVVFSMAPGWAAELPNPHRYEGQTVTEVRFEPPGQPVTSEELSSLVLLKPGAKFRVPDLRQSLKNLFATGRYTDVRAEGEPAQGGVAVVFRTEQEWFVARVQAEGDLGQNPTRGQVADAARLGLGRPLYPEELEEATGRIRQLLTRNGFYEARVEPVLQRDPGHQLVHVRFAVHPGQRARLADPVVSGEPLMEAPDIIGATKWKGWFGWKPLTEDRLQRGLQNVRRKYEKRDRLMASVVVEGMEYDPENRRVVPRLRVIGGPKVEIHTEGAGVSQKKLKQYVPIFAERAVDRDLLVEGARHLRDYFQSRGYYDVEVDFEQTRPQEDHHDIVYRINPGPRQKLVRVEVRGNRYFDRATIRERMFLQPAGWVRLRHGRYSEGFVRRDEDSIKAVYQANGFRDVEVATRTMPVHAGKPGEMAVVVTIEEGPQYLVSEFAVDGLEQMDPERILPVLASMEGQPFSETNVALDRDFIIRTYQAEGFAETRFDWAMEPGPGPHQIRVRYRIDEGQRRVVRDVLISGMEITRQRLVSRTIRPAPGSPLSLRDMTQTQRDLYELGIFDKIDVAVQNPEGDTDRKNVLYQIDEGHRYHIAGGLGAELARIGGGPERFDAPAGATGFSPRANFEASRLHLWGLGHSLNFKSRVSTLNRRALLNYSAPRYRNVEGRNISVTALFDDSRDVRTFSARRWETSAQLSQMWTRALTTLYRFSFRRTTVDPNTLKISPLLIPQLAQPVRIGMFSTSFVHDRRDDPADSSRGMYNTADVGLASNWFASRRNFVRFLGRNSTYHAFRHDVVLARNVQFGWLGPFRLGGLAPEQAVPLPERFFGGGSTSHRGFPDNQAGPRDAFTGFPLGGNALVFHNTELRFPLLGENINGVLFHDMGNVFSRPGRISWRVRQRDLNDFDYMVHAVGFGIRYRTPVGPVRVDLAYSMNPPRFIGFRGDREDLLFQRGERTEQRISGFQFFFSIGQTF